jgi:hypothetical protein
MKGILSVTWWRLFWASPDEGYFESHLMKAILSVTGWRVFWASPDEGYFERPLMKGITETCRVLYIWYLRHYYYFLLPVLNLLHMYIIFRQSPPITPNAEQILLFFLIIQKSITCIQKTPYNSKWLDSVHSCFGMTSNHPKCGIDFILFFLIIQTSITYIQNNSK